MESANRVIDLKNFTEVQFVERFGGLYEHSPWVAEAVWAEINAAQGIDIDDLAVRCLLYTSPSPRDRG